MDLTPTLLWQVVTTLAIAPLAYFLKASLDRLRQMEICLSRTREQLAREYATKADLHADVGRVLGRRCHCRHSAAAAGARGVIASLWARVQGWLALAGATLAAIGAAYLAGRRDGRDAAKADAATAERTTRRAADAAARKAERAGAVERLRRGDF